MWWILFQSVKVLNLFLKNPPSKCFSGLPLKRIVKKVLTANVVVAIVLGSNPASSDTVESEGRQIKHCWISYIKKIKSKNSPLKKTIITFRSNLTCMYSDYDLLISYPFVNDGLKLKAVKAVTFLRSPETFTVYFSWSSTDHFRPLQVKRVAHCVFPPKFLCTVPPFER